MLISGFFIFINAGILQADTIDGIVAVVDKQLIMRSDLNKRLLVLGINPNNDIQSRKILELMIEEIVIEKTYAKYGLAAIPPSQITEMATYNKINYDTAKILIMRKSLMDMMVASRVVVTQQMIKDYYDNEPEYSGSLSLKLQQIAIKDDKAKADKAMSEIKSGKSFEDVGRKYSEILNKGTCDLGWVELNQLDPAAETLLSKAQVGAVEGPININDYWCIFKVIDKETTGAKDFDSVKADISTALETKLREDAFEHWLRQIMGEYFIGIYM